MKYNIGTKLIVKYDGLASCPFGSTATIKSIVNNRYYVFYNHLKTIAPGNGYTEEEIEKYFKILRKIILVDDI